MAFRVGQKVVCVDDVECSWFDFGEDTRPNHPKKGGVYTVRWSGPFTFDVGVRAGVYLVEIENPKFLWDVGEFCEAAFGADRFRPVVEQSTNAGMAILREILDRETTHERKQARV
jgi:hypothetical protein